MTRTEWIRLGSAVLALTLAPPHSLGAMIRLDLATTLAADADVSLARWRLAPDPLDLEAALSRRLDAGVHSLNAYYGVPVVDWTRELVLPGWTTGDFSEIRPRPTMLVGDESASFSRAAEGPSTGPPLTLAGFMGVAAWAVVRRRVERRPRRPVRPRPAPVRATSTAIASARRPRRSDGSAAERFLVLPARFVTVSTTNFPARRVEAAVVGVRRRGHVRRISNGSLVRDR